MKAGFVINSRVPSVDSLLRRGMPPHSLIFGWDDAASPMSFMRFRWIAKELKTEASYELFRPSRRYDVVVFVKSMGEHAAHLARKLQGRGSKIVFDANVDYYSEACGQQPAFPEMIPTVAQRENAIEMTALADLVLASSRRLTDLCSTFAQKAVWIPDNVNLALAPKQSQICPVKDGRVQLWWSGMPEKLFEFLSIEDALASVAGRIHLHLVTKSLKATERWPANLRDRFGKFLEKIPHTIHPFTTIRALMELYGNGGYVLSPRFLELPYNRSHSEWKLTLAMACGLPSICSPVPSYRDVQERAAAGAVTICNSGEAWREALEKVALGQSDFHERSRAAREVVEKCYSTRPVARRHWEALQSL